MRRFAGIGSTPIPEQLLKGPTLSLCAKSAHEKEDFLLTRGGTMDLNVKVPLVNPVISKGSRKPKAFASATRFQNG